MDFVTHLFRYFRCTRASQRPIGRHILSKGVSLALVIVLLLTGACTNNDSDEDDTSESDVPTQTEAAVEMASPAPTPGTPMGPSGDVIVPPGPPPDMPESEDGDEIEMWQQMLSHADSTTRWKALSLLTNRLWRDGDFDRLSNIVGEMLETEDDPDLLAQAHLVQAHNELRMGRPESAIAHLESVDLLQEQGDTWHWKAVRLQAHAYRVAGNPEAALETFTLLIDLLPEGDTLADARYQLADLYIELGDIEPAQQLLAANLEGEFEIAAYLVEASEQRLFLLEQAPGPAYEEMDALLFDIGEAFGNGDVELITELIDASQFVAGTLGGHSAPPDPAWFDALFINSAENGRMPRLPGQPIQIEGDSPDEVFVLSYDWLVEEVWNDAWLRFTLKEEGWRWTGLWFVPQRVVVETDLEAEEGVSRQPVDVLVSTRNSTTASTTKPDLQPLGFDLLAPWAEGHSMLGGTWFLGDPTPVVGGRCTDLVGWPGQYYAQGNHGDSYDDSEYYAIDFLKWGTRAGFCPIPWFPWITICVWPWPSSGTPVVAVAQGRVASISHTTNSVTIKHLDDQGQPTGYRSTYMHMQPVVVFEDQYVAQGTLLGYVGAQGTAEAHLHFHLRLDIDPTGKIDYEPAMPSPMDGITLDWSGARQCITSTNSDTFVDSDGDNIYDTFDNCPDTYNPYHLDATGKFYQPDTDGDGWGDACACSSDADCDGTSFCNRALQPPECSRPACVDDRDCYGTSKCEGSGADAECVPMADVLDCTDVNAMCLIGYDERIICDNGETTTVSFDVNAMCPDGRRQPSSAHERECLSASRDLLKYIECQLAGQLTYQAHEWDKHIYQTIVWGPP